jgi:hypothetical protein
VSYGSCEPGFIKVQRQRKVKKIFLAVSGRYKNLLNSPRKTLIFVYPMATGFLEKIAGIETEMDMPGKPMLA